MQAEPRKPRGGDGRKSRHARLPLQVGSVDRVPEGGLSYDAGPFSTLNTATPVPHPAKCQRLTIRH